MNGSKQRKQSFLESIGSNGSAAGACPAILRPGMSETQLRSSIHASIISNISC